jgi:hypothetical protein
VHATSLVVLGLTACSFHPGSAGSPSIDAPDDCGTWQPHHFDACAIPAPDGPLDVSGAATFDTDSGMLTGSSTVTPTSTTISASGVDSYLISITTLNIQPGATLRVIGSKPLIVAAWEMIDVQGTIDTGSTPSQAGAGANPSSLCAMAIPGSAQSGADMPTTSGGSGGGGGGGFRGAGGHGGTGNDAPMCVGGVGGTAVEAPTVVRGGCSGAPSGKAGPAYVADPNIVSVAGLGGGAIQLTARRAINLGAAAQVLAGGGGGGGAVVGAATGGAGGGAGGLIGLDAPITTIAGATLAANGGGGGSSGQFAGMGHVGQDGQPSASAATGGMTDSTCAAAGCDGGAGATFDGVSSANPLVGCGGSGGGGGAGFILTWGVVMKSDSPVISPVELAGPT